PRARPRQQGSRGSFRNISLEPPEAPFLLLPRRPVTLTQHVPARRRLLTWGLPAPCSRFLWRRPGEFPVTALLLGAGTGGLLAVGLFQLLVNPMNIYEDQKMAALYGLVGLGAVGWGTSPHIRCASLLLVPKMLGKEGRLFVLGYALAAIYEGPAANLRRNVNEVVASLGCTVELQVNNTRAAWRVSTAPLLAVFKGLQGSQVSLKAETQNISKSFGDLDSQVNSDVGYSPKDSAGSAGMARGVGTHGAPASRQHLSTQKMYELKTRLRCSCERPQPHPARRPAGPPWASLCFLGDLWTLCLLSPPPRARDGQGPGRGGHWGSCPTAPAVGQLSGWSCASQWACGETDTKEPSRRSQSRGGKRAPRGTEVRGPSEGPARGPGWALGTCGCHSQALGQMSFSYVDSYNGDIRYDNIYISTYFRQIDERRRKLGKRTLLPLRRAEEKTVIFPCDPFMQASEMRNVARELAETVPVLLLLLLLCGLDWALYSIFAAIRRHSFLQYSFRSSHKLEVKVGGDSMLARLLRKTIGALNTSSETVVETSNLPCLPQPVSLSPGAYLRAALPAGLLLSLCLLQAFGYRLRRVIAAFCFPKREKQRILFLYNDLLRRRAAFTKLRRAAIVSRAQQQGAPRHPLADVLHRRCPLLRPWLRRRCVVCQAPETPQAYECPTPDCAAVYCRSCWDDMRRRCPACTPREELSSSAYSDSNDDATYAE
uniref:DC-STAMP domain containing 1 n=1 Tax=Suricata suricatta TaxID=37032 RepID=A0A673TC01_SURSU